MRVSTLLVGVNVAASLSVAVQGQAQAGVEKSVDFLKSSLSISGNSARQSAASEKPVSRLKSRSKVSLSSSKSVAVRDVLAGKKLRPFQKNRKLPTRAELQAASLRAMSAKADHMHSAPVHSAPAVLTGSASVKGYASSPYYASSEVRSHMVSARAKRAVKKEARRQRSSRLATAAQITAKSVHAPAPRSVPGTRAAIPGRVGASSGIQCGSSHDFKISMANPGQPQPHSQAFSIPYVSGAQSHAGLAFSHQGVGSSQVQSPLMSHMVSQSRMDGLYSRVGAPPFPLNLVPEPAMKAFLMRARNRKSMISEYPGSFTGTARNLPNSGFHSYARTLGGNRFHSYAGTISGFGQYGRKKAVRSHARAHSGKYSRNLSKHARANRYSVSQPVHGVSTIAHKAHAKVATYGPYAGPHAIH